MTRDISIQRCYNHAWREAAARCPECERYFCRECVTEHEDRVLCASCLERLTLEKDRGRARFDFLVRAFQLAAGLMIVWVFFMLIGRGLLALPSSFHEGTLWQTGILED